MAAGSVTGRRRVTVPRPPPVAAAASKRISGKDVTPFLLGRVVELTGGDSLATNIELVLNNSRLASAIAVQIAGLGGYDRLKASQMNR